MPSTGRTGHRLSETEPDRGSRESKRRFGFVVDANRDPIYPCLVAGGPHASRKGSFMSDAIYDIEVQKMGGEKYRLDAYRGKVMLVVNTASRCGFTPQFTGLEKLHEEFEAEGLAILGFPCNQFGRQDPGSEEEIREFCDLEYGVRFPMHAKIDVNGADAHPLFAHLKEEAPGLLGSRSIKWNFTKFLVGRGGEVIHRYGSASKPEEIEASIRDALKSGE